MARRIFDVTLAVAALVLLAPVWLIAAIGIRATSPGPVLFFARRVGRNGQEFTLYKFRTMRVGAEREGGITAAMDSRVFAFGRWLRDWKVDELPQLLNVLKGEMSIVGPRPEDPDIVSGYFRDDDYSTLTVLPGLASPGSIFNYTHGDRFLAAPDAAAAYVERLLPIKLGLDRVYVQHASLMYDLRIIVRTLVVLAMRMTGRTRFADPPEMDEWRRTASLPGIHSHQSKAVP